MGCLSVFIKDFYIFKRGVFKSTRVSKYFLIFGAVEVGHFPTPHQRGSPLGEHSTSTLSLEHLALLLDPVTTRLYARQPPQICDGGKVHLRTWRIRRNRPPATPVASTRYAIAIGPAVAHSTRPLSAHVCACVCSCVRVCACI